MTAQANGEQSASPFREAVEQLARVPLPDQGKPLDLQTLADAFSLFNQTTAKLETAHRELEKRVQQVDAELERKNRELAQANQDLHAKIAELDRMRSYLNNLIDSMGSGLVCTDGEGRVTTVNRAAEQLTGWSASKVLSQPLETLFGPESRPAIEGLVGSRDVRQNLDLSLLDRQGGKIPVRGTTAPIVDEVGEPLGTILTFIDQSSVRLLEERVKRSGRLAALGELAAGVAHEMRNPLTTIRGFIQILPQERNDPEFLKEFSTNVLREIDRLTKLTEDLLNFAKPTTMNVQPADGERLLDEVVAFLADKFERAGVQVSLQRPPEPLRIPMDCDRVKQVLLNLILNAIEAMPDGGRLRLTLGQVKERLESQEREDPFAAFEVVDTGQGIPPEHLERLFDPFFTTKDAGTGLGLAVSHRIVEEHQGFLRVESERGVGTTFHMLLPLQPNGTGKD